MTKEISPEKSEDVINQLIERMDNFSDVLEKFGMDLITRLGQGTFNIKVLNDKIDTLSKATIDIKALSPQLKTIIDKQNKLEQEIELLKSLILQKGKTPVNEDEHENNSISANTKIKTKKIIADQFRALKEDLDADHEMPTLIDNLNTIKEEVFEFTGGHKLLYEVSQYIKTLKKENSLSEQTKKELKNSIESWITRL